VNSGRDTAAGSSPPAPAEAGGGFAAVVSELGLLPHAEAARLCAAALQEQLPPSRYAVLQGALQPTDADIVETLLHPTAAIPGYHILGLIGRGGMGVVYRARQLSLNRLVALKTILLSHLSNPTASRRFEQEAQALARLTHPHIVSAYDFGRQGDRLYLAMELIDGEDVDELLRRRGALPESLVWALIRQAAAGLAHAASAGIVHRDVKPANLLMVPPPEGYLLPPGVPLVKVADFGLALLAHASGDSPHRLTSASVHVGSPIYMAPEQLESGPLDQRADIFSLGATAWHMLAGYPPLHGRTLRELITLRLSSPTDPIVKHNPSVSNASADLLAAMLQPNPAQRLGNYDQLLSEIDRITGRTPATADLGATTILPGSLPAADTAASTDVTAQLPRQAQTPARKAARRTMAVSCAAGVLLLAVGLIWSLWPPRPVARQFVGHGRPVALFDGRTLTGWKTLGGAWEPSLDPEGGTVLVGTNGIASRVLAATDEHFCLEGHVSYDEARAVEFQFDFATTAPERLVVRIEHGQVTVGRRSSDQGAITKPDYSSLPTGVTPPGGGMTIRVERQDDAWRLVLDGQEVATVPGCRAVSLPELRLRVEQGTAQFADLFYEALTPAK